MFTFYKWISSVLANVLNGSFFINDHITLVVKKESLIDVIRFLKSNSHCQFIVLSDIAGVDYPFRANRFEVVYQLLSIRYNCRITVKVNLASEEAVPSITSIHESANWYEREAFDLFGIFFSNHPDLRRILTDYGFEGHPMRKDFPLTGFHELRYDIEKKRVVCEPLELSQEFRNYTFNSSSQLTKPVIS
nr:NADH dehydrogenase subunit 9 [Schizochytrium sp. TIO1101]